MQHGQVPGGFAQASAVAADGPGRYTGELAGGWDILGAVNGGYQLAVVARALAAETGRVPVTITGHYLAAGRPGPVVVDTTMVKRGSSFSTADATLRQGDKALVAVLGSFGSLEQGGEILLQDAQPPDLPPEEECARMDPDPARGLPPPFFARVDAALHPYDAGFARGRPTGTPHLRAWFRLHDHEPIDPFGLILAADCLPPTIFNAGLPLGWTPTLELTVHIRARPAPGPLRLDVRTRFISHGRLDIDGLIWDSADRMVAQSRQLALVPRPPD
jgi:acyl-CoA thioesterase